jgi:hypothetical protein
MKTKTLYLKAEAEWNTAVTIELSNNDETEGCERSAYVRWEMQFSCPEGELWISSRGERAFNLAAILDPAKIKKLNASE